MLPGFSGQRGNRRSDTLAARLDGRPVGVDLVDSPLPWGMPRDRLPPNLPPLPDELPPFPVSPPLEARAVDLVGWWIDARCACGQAASLPLRFLAARYGWNTRPGELVPRLACSRCHAPAARLRLAENPSFLDRAFAAVYPRTA
jgi:hypothetical protein